MVSNANSRCILSHVRCLPGLAFYSRIFEIKNFTDFTNAEFVDLVGELKPPWQRVRAVFATAVLHLRCLRSADANCLPEGTVSRGTLRVYSSATA